MVTRFLITLYTFLGFNCFLPPATRRFPFTLEFRLCSREFRSKRKEAERGTYGNSLRSRCDACRDREKKQNASNTDGIRTENERGNLTNAIIYFVNHSFPPTSKLKLRFRRSRSSYSIRPKANDGAPKPWNARIRSVPQREKWRSTPADFRCG